MLKEYLKSEGFSRFITLVILVVFLISIGSMLNLLLFTFIFTFLMGRLEQFVTAQLNKVIRVNSKSSDCIFVHNNGYFIGDCAV